ncbi:hypothetical protein RHSIM_Rhsim01G0121300 [Rhododendron simsii]|uniref:Uncharacterized protein n=1 Tax=Rhododendron simsii TaxID=118357 RepID=A0A834LXY2_RHOSS|nr:hypothetical protein RHSIM_Rhsim01G0121300 [Rhododendron simsii]
MTVLEPHLPDRVLRQFGMVQLVSGPPLVPLQGSRGANSHSYNVVHAYTDGQWENWRDHVMNAEKRVTIQPGVPVLGETRVMTSTSPYELRQALVEVRRTLRGPEAAEASIAGPSSDRYSSHYTRCGCREHT